MKYKILFTSLLLSAVSVFLFAGSGTSAAHNSAPLAGDAVSHTLVISQFQAGGTAIASDEFVEIHNVGTTAIDLNGYKVVYRSQNGMADVGPFAAWSSSRILQPGQYFLVASSPGYDGTVVPDITWNPGIGSMAAANGGLAIRDPANNIVDAVGWGTGSNIFFEGTRTTAPGNDNSQIRRSGGCQDTDNNLDDFANQVPSAPRNTASTPVICSGGGATLFASMSASPSTVSPGATTLLAVTVIPATVPPSTNITVVGDLTDIGGPSSQPFYDDGTHGDITAGDNIFSFLATVTVETMPGVHIVSAVAADGEGRTVPLTQNLTIAGVLPDEDPLTFGNPSNATANVTNENNYLMVKPQYTISYNRSRNEANWVAWRLDSSWIGGANRQDDFRPDTTLPAGWYQVTPEDYSEPVYDRGHMCPSGDRTRSIPDNSATFLMTNMVPQLPANNQGPWADFENYCRSLVASGNELYIISGPSGNVGTIGATQQNRVVVPAVTWKVVIVLPNGSGDVSRVTRSTRAFGVIMSNTSISMNAPWRNFRVTVNAVEYLTGYDFFSAIPKNTQELIEKKRDQQ